MAIRRIFFKNGINKDIEFIWHPGFAISQKQKNIEELHSILRRSGNKPLEISTKSKERIGKMLSAFNMNIEINGIATTIEVVYQSSKIFNGFEKSYSQLKPINDLDSKTVKKVIAEFSRGEKLIGFWDPINKVKITGKKMDLFYNYLFLYSLVSMGTEQRKYIEGELVKYDCFTDIEFNPEKSRNCQADFFSKFINFKLLEEKLKNLRKEILKDEDGKNENEDKQIKLDI